MFKTTSLKKNEKKEVLKSVNITITGKVVEKSKSFSSKRPWISVKEYAIIRDESEKVYDILGYEKKDDSNKNTIKGFNII